MLLPLPTLGLSSKVKIWYNCVMVSEQAPETNKITPAIAEKKVSEAVDDIVDQDYVVEEDGDFFWVIQRISWGIIKTMLALLVIGGIVWLIWGGKIPSFGGGPNDSPPPGTVNTPVVDTPSKPPKKTDPKTDPPSDGTITDPINVQPVVNTLSIERLAYQLANQNVVVDTSTTITRATQWLKDVKRVGDISTTLLRLSSPSVRSDRIEATILEAEALLNQSSELQRQLSEELNYFFNLGQTANTNIVALDNQIAVNLSQFNGAEVEKILAQKIGEQQVAATSLSQAKVRQTLLQNVQNFDRLLRQKSIPLLQPTELRANPK